MFKVHFRYVGEGRGKIDKSLRTHLRFAKDALKGTPSQKRETKKARAPAAAGALWEAGIGCSCTFAPR